MMDWEERGKLRSCLLLISVLCLLAPERTWRNQRQPAVSVISICGENGTQELSTLRLLIVTPRRLLSLLYPVASSSSESRTAKRCRLQLNTKCKRNTH
jgi:hypothetical protein